MSGLLCRTAGPKTGRVGAMGGYNTRLPRPFFLVPLSAAGAAAAIYVVVVVVAKYTCGRACDPGVRG